MTKMMNPPQPPAATLRTLLATLDITVTAAARQLGISRVMMSRLLHGGSGISPEMALRIETWLGRDRGGSAEVWLRMQGDYDLWLERQKVRRKPLGVVPVSESAGTLLTEG